MHLLTLVKKELVLDRVAVDAALAMIFLFMYMFLTSGFKRVNNKLGCHIVLTLWKEYTSQRGVYNTYQGKNISSFTCYGFRIWFYLKGF